MAVPAALQPGEVIGGRYEIVAPISSGAMGAVFRARGDDREVALKLLTNPGQGARFDIEARLLGRLSHPRVVDVVDHGRDGDRDWLVMELVEGRDLSRVLGERGAPGLPQAEVLEAARQAAEALQYVHDQQIVHRDVKPHNLVLAGDGVVLVDFGVAREATRDTGTRGIGTPKYMAPEVLVGEGVSPRSDVYGLAATVWTLLSGAPPAYGDPDPLPGVEPELEQALRRALDPRPEHRFASAAALVAALGSPVEEARGRPLAATLPGTERADVLASVVRTAAGVFDAAAASIALIDETTGELVYRSSWGVLADETVGIRLSPGEGLAGAAVAGQEPVVVPDCRADERFAAQVAAGIGYVPNTMLVVPLRRDGVAVGALSILDRRDGEAMGQADVARAELFGDLALAVL
ncbi:MAG TPA: protein kinase [Thermoleophilaceae bacterium]|nr:protein kinase [Thermoleophilaceae bacterium]